MAKRLSWYAGQGHIQAYAVKNIEDAVGKYLRSLGDYEVIMSHKLMKGGHRVYADVPDELATLLLLLPPLVGNGHPNGYPDVEDITNDVLLDHTQVR